MPKVGGGRTGYIIAAYNVNRSLEENKIQGDEDSVTK